MSTRPGAASRHWRNQRLTAVALIPLSLWFLVALLRQPSLEHAVVAGWLGKPLQAVLAALLGAALLWHSMQGVQVVLEDYVRGRMLALLIVLARIAHLGAALALGYAVWVLAARGAA
jgi:succinate dehydrogenase / fumarate reductase membrane anchor subunit